MATKMILFAVALVVCNFLWYLYGVTKGVYAARDVIRSKVEDVDEQMEEMTEYHVIFRWDLLWIYRIFIASKLLSPKRSIDIISSDDI